MRATKFKIPVKRFDRVVKTALSSPVEHFENKLVFWRKSCFLFTFWTGSELSFSIFAEISSRFVQIGFLSRVGRIVKDIFLSKQSNFFSSFDFREKNHPTNDACPAKLSKLRSTCPKNRFEGTLVSGENPNFLSFSGFNEKTSNVFKNCQTGLSKLRFHVKKNLYGKKRLYNIGFFSQPSGF